MTKLPKTWEVKTLKEFGIFIRGVSYKKEQLLKEKTQDSVFLLRANNIQDKLTLNDLQIVPKNLANGKIINDDDILFAMSSGSPHMVGKNIIVRNLKDCSFGAFCGVFRNTSEALNSTFLSFFLKTESCKKYILKSAKGTNINNLRFSDLENLKIPLPPIETQKQIVEILESKFAKIENATNALNLVKKDLVKLKASLLNSAFNGTLLQDNNLQTLSRDDTAFNLPQDWEVKTLGEIAKIKGGKRLPKGSAYSKEKTKYPYIRVTDFANMSVDMSDLKFLSEEVQAKIKNYTISKNDVYISIAGSIGKAGIIPDELDNANLTENAAKIVHNINKKYLAFCLNSSNIQTQIKFYTKATTQPKLALFRIENLKIPLPPLKTQKQIVEILESKFKGIEKLDYFVNDSLDKLSKLKASLLNKAFSGELVC